MSLKTRAFWLQRAIKTPEDYDANVVIPADERKELLDTINKKIPLKVFKYKGTRVDVCSTIFHEVIREIVRLRKQAYANGNAKQILYRIITEETYPYTGGYRRFAKHSQVLHFLEVGDRGNLIPLGRAYFRGGRSAEVPHDFEEFKDIDHADDHNIFVEVTPDHTFEHLCHKYTDGRGNERLVYLQRSVVTCNKTCIRYTYSADYTTPKKVVTLLGEKVVRIQQGKEYETKKKKLKELKG